MAPEHKLQLVKLAHTVIWAVFAGCIVAIPVFAFQGRLGVAAVLIAVVLGEVLVLAVNGMRCPLTDVASRYTAQRQANFDIYLPLWLARHNQRIFGTLYVVGTVYALATWWAGR